MNYSTYRFTLDLQRHQSNMAIAVFQYDSAVQLRISLTDGGKPYFIEEGSYAVFYGKRPDVPLCLDCDIHSNSEIIFNFNDTVTAKLGKVTCQIRLYGKDKELITAPRFTIIVEERVVDDDDIEIVDSDLSALDQIFMNEASRVSAELAREDAEDARADAENVRQQNEENRLAKDQEIEAKLNEALETTENAKNTADNAAEASSNALSTAKATEAKFESFKNESASNLSNAISAHNTSGSAHNDIRLQLSQFIQQVNTLLDSDDTTLDQMSEVVAYIKANKTLIESITTSKVNVSDIIDNLITSVSNKPLSAKQGVALKALIDKNASDIANNPSCVSWTTLFCFDGAYRGESVNIQSSELNEYADRHECRPPHVGDIVWDDSGDMYEITMVEEDGTLELLKRIPVDRLIYELDQIKNIGCSNTVWTTEDEGLDFSYLQPFEVTNISWSGLTGTYKDRYPQKNDIVIDDSMNILRITFVDFSYHTVELKMVMLNPYAQIGDIETALDNIISIQETLIGGNA